MIELRADMLVRERHNRQNEGCGQDSGDGDAVHVRVLLRLRRNGNAGAGVAIISPLRAVWRPAPAVPTMRQCEGAGAANDS